MCKLCEVKPVYEFTNKRKLCARCFVNWFQKKFLYTIRKFEMIKSEEFVGYESKGDFRGVVLEDVLKMFVSRGDARLRKGKNNVSKFAVADTSSLIADEIVKVLFSGKTSVLKDFNPVNGKVIKPLYLFLDREVLLYAKLRGLEFKNVLVKKNKLDEFVDELEEKHPELKHSVVNSYLELFG